MSRKSICHFVSVFALSITEKKLNFFPLIPREISKTYVHDKPLNHTSLMVLYV